MTVAVSGIYLLIYIITDNKAWILNGNFSYLSYPISYKTTYEYIGLISPWELFVVLGSTYF